MLVKVWRNIAGGNVKWKTNTLAVPPKSPIWSYHKTQQFSLRYTPQRTESKCLHKNLGHECPQQDYS